MKVTITDTWKVTYKIKPHIETDRQHAVVVV